MQDDDPGASPSAAGQRIACEACNGTGFAEDGDWMETDLPVCRVCYGAGELDDSDPHDPVPPPRPGQARQ